MYDFDSEYNAFMCDVTNFERANPCHCHVHKSTLDDFFAQKTFCDAVLLHLDASNEAHSILHYAKLAWNSIPEGSIVVLSNTHRESTQEALEWLTSQGNSYALKDWKCSSKKEWHIFSVVPLLGAYGTNKEIKNSSGVSPLLGAYGTNKKIKNSSGVGPD